MDKQAFLATLRATRTEWEDVLARVPERRMTQPGAAGEWSVKDVIAHVAWHEWEMLGVLRQHALRGSEMWAWDLHQRNAAIYEQYRQRPLAEVQEDERRVYRDLLQALESAEPDDFTDPSRFAEMAPEWVPGQILAENTYEHYQQHLPDLYAWIDKASFAGR